MSKKPSAYYCELYKMNFWFCIKWQPAEFSKLMRTNFALDMDMYGVGGYCVSLTSDNKDIIIIWTNPKDPIALVHEVIHAANLTLAARGVLPDFVNDEPQTYLAELIYRKAIGKPKSKAK